MSQQNDRASITTISTLNQSAFGAFKLTVARRRFSQPRASSQIVLQAVGSKQCSVSFRSTGLVRTLLESVTTTFRGALTIIEMASTADPRVRA
jgi:hypothetical protein